MFSSPVFIAIFRTCAIFGGNRKKASGNKVLANASVCELANITLATDAYVNQPLMSLCAFLYNGLLASMSLPSAAKKEE